MSIALQCSCGKSLQVKDEHAGKRVRCPACSDVLAVPKSEPAFEVVEDEEPVPRAAPVRAKVVAVSRDRDDDDDDEDDDRPRSKRKGYDVEDEEEEDRPRKKKKRKPKRKNDQPQEHSHFGLEKSIMTGGVAGGLLAMIIAVVWFVVGLMNDRIFFYPPILLIVGLVAFFKGLMGGGDE